MTPYRRAPRRATLALDEIRAELEPATLLAEVQRVWREAVGAAIALEAQPSAERRGVVTVSCSASVWAQELDLMAPAILERLNELLDQGGGSQLTRLRCVTLPSGV
jgi:predicted nucleic acid-binding Zn ribbon protein